MSNDLREDIRLARLRHEQYVNQAEQIAMRARETAKPQVPIWEKVAMTLEEAAEYSSIGINQLREITNRQGCPFVFWVGRRRLIKRKAFDKYIDNLHVV